MQPDISIVVTYATTIVTAVVVVIGLIGAMRTRQSKLPTFQRQGVEIAEVPSSTSIEPERRERSVTVTSLDLQTEQLRNYYSQALAQAKFSFWFSLIFASIGFLIIVAAGLKTINGDIAANIIQIVSGVIVDSISALFYMQANKTQESMMQFFEKLRIDRQQIDSISLCKEISSDDLRDSLMKEISLHLAGITNNNQQLTQNHVNK